MTADAPFSVPLSPAEAAQLRDFATKRGLSDEAAATELLQAGLSDIAHRGKRGKPAPVVPLPSVPMTPAQIALARHALGLPNKQRRSFRNHYIAFPGREDYDAWLAMVEQGHAGRRAGKPGRHGGADSFWLTPAGAAAALNAREKLDPEDFPT